MLGSQISYQKVEFFTRGRHENLDVYYISQSHFGLPRQSSRNNSDRIIFFKQTFRFVETTHKDIGVYDTFHIEFKEMCRKTSSE